MATGPVDVGLEISATWEPDTRELQRVEGLAGLQNEFKAKTGC